MCWKRMLLLVTNWPLPLVSSVAFVVNSGIDKTSQRVFFLKRSPVMYAGWITTWQEPCVIKSQALVSLFNMMHSYNRVIICLTNGCLNADDTWHVYSRFTNNELEICPIQKDQPRKGRRKLTGDL